MGIYGWPYLRTARDWSTEEAKAVLQNLINAHHQGQELTLPEKEHLYFNMRFLRSSEDNNYAFNLRQLSEFSEAVFHDTFITYQHYNNLMGEKIRMNYPEFYRSFPVKEDMNILDSALANWEVKINNLANKDNLIIRLRKDRKILLKRLDRMWGSRIIGFRRWKYLRKKIMLLSYDIYIFIQSLFDDEAVDPILIFEGLDKPVYLNKAVTSHIMFMHYYPDLNEIRGNKSLFDQNNSPYELVFHLRQVFEIAANHFDKDKVEVKKMEYLYKGRIIRCRLDRANDNQSYEITTMHPLEDPIGMDHFKSQSIQTTDPEIVRTLIH